MELKIYDVVLSRKKIKCTVHKSGNLGFSAAAATLMKLEKEGYVHVARDIKSPESDDLFFIVLDKYEMCSYKVMKMGKYYYIQIGGLLNSLDIDYKGKKIIYDLNEIKYRDMWVYHGKKRLVERKKQEMNDLKGD